MNAPERPLRVPRADELKRRIKPGTFYARELPEAPVLKARDGGWSQNVACPFHDDAEPSFGVNLETGAYRCFGCGAEGGGIVDFAIQRHGLSLADARSKLAADYGVDGKGEATPTSAQAPRGAEKDRKDRPRFTLEPVPEAALVSRPKTHPKHGEPSATWTYRDAAGQVLFFMCRFDLERGRKQFAPQTYSDRRWQWKAPPEPRPLYGLERLSAKPDALVVLTEGEKAADAAMGLFPDAVAVTTPNGAQAPGKADFGPLAGRRVLIWPDNDAPGANYARVVEALARKEGAVSVDRVDLAALACEPGTEKARTLPAGWDAADALADGWTAETLAEALRRGPRANAEDLETASQRGGPGGGGAPARGDEPPAPFQVARDGIYWRKPEKGHDGSWRPGDGDALFVCPPFRMVAVTRDETGTDFGRLIEFQDLDGITRREIIADRERHKAADDLRARLAAVGFEVSTHPEGKKHFLELLRRWTPPGRARAVSKTGWTLGGAYVLPERVIGEGAEPVVLAVEGERPAFSVRGTLEDWREHVGRLCAGNSRLLFCVSVAFAAPLLGLLRIEGGGFHLRGDSLNASSTGKTTVQLVVVSVCGPPEYLQRWRTTDNALEALAERHNDAVLVLDDLGQMDARAVGESAYLLANGSGKARLDRGSNARPVRRWRLLFLSSGEISLRERMAEAGQRMRAGQDLRMAEIPADAGAGHGAFEELHGYSHGAAFSQALTKAAEQFHGAPLIAWIETLARECESVPARVPELRDKCAARLLGDITEPSGQVRRVADRFALVAAAGELATEAGITGWAPGAVLDAAAACFEAWLKARGGAIPLEERQLVEQVELWLEGNLHRLRWKSRASDDHAPEIGKPAGFKELPERQGKPEIGALQSGQDDGALRLFVLPETFKQEVVKGYNPADAARLLVRLGVLTPGSDGRPDSKVRLPGYKNPQRCYVFDRLGSEPPDDGL